ncbi:hypothetical protein, partial [uncultured Tateyamaria sp.]|uniref:hypothetical protein n=1 Tax=uncultured Tateyamaria sp. TaxID=455651 RepID=UPI00260B2833
SNKRSNHRASQGEFFNNISPKRTMLRSLTMAVSSIRQGIGAGTVEFRCHNFAVSGAYRSPAN